MDDDFDILYMVKTPFFLGQMDKAAEECVQQAAEIQPDDVKNVQSKNLLFIRILTSQSNFQKLKEHMQMMVADPAQQKDVQAISILVQYIAQKKIDVNYVLTQHDLFTKDPSLQLQPQNQTAMTTLVYYYIIEQQYTNLFQLLNETKNMEFLAIKIVGYLHINRFDLAQQTLAKMKQIEEDNCLVVLCQCWLTFHDPSSPIQSYEQTVSNLSDLSQKFGYTLKTYNILGIVLMIQGQFDKAEQIFENALQENQIYELMEAGADESRVSAVLQASNQELACIIYNLIKCHLVNNGHLGIVLDSYKESGLQSFIRSDEKLIKLFSLLQKMQSPLAKAFFDERQAADAMFDAAVKQIL